MLLVLRTYRRAKREATLEIANGCFCYLLAMAGYTRGVALFGAGLFVPVCRPWLARRDAQLRGMRTMRSSHTGQASIPLCAGPAGEQFNR